MCSYCVSLCARMLINFSIRMCTTVVLNLFATVCTDWILISSSPEIKAFPDELSKLIPQRTRKPVTRSFKSKATRPSSLSSFPALEKLIIDRKLHVLFYIIIITLRHSHNTVVIFPQTMPLQKRRNDENDRFETTTGVFWRERDGG